MTTRSHSPSSTSVDRLGALASTACALHCMVSAVLPGAMIGLGLGHEAEWGFTFAAVLVAALALALGWPKHRSRPVAATLTVGIVGLLLARWVEEGGGHVAGTVLGVGAGLALVIGHVWGVRASRRACDATDCRGDVARARASVGATGS